MDCKHQKIEGTPIPKLSMVKRL